MRVRWNGDPTEPAFLEKHGIRFPKGQWVMRPESERDKYEHDGTFEVDQLSPATIRTPAPETTTAPVTPVPNTPDEHRNVRHADEGDHDMASKNADKGKAPTKPATNDRTAKDTQAPATSERPRPAPATGRR